MTSFGVPRGAAAHRARDGATNYFQLAQTALVQRTVVKVEKTEGRDQVTVRWNTAIAAAKPIASYEIRSGDKVLLSVPYRPQLTPELLWASVPAAVGSVTVRAAEKQQQIPRFRLPHDRVAITGPQTRSTRDDTCIFFHSTV